MGKLANDGILCLLPKSFTSQTNNLYLGDAFFLIAIITSVAMLLLESVLKRYQFQAQEHLNINHVEYQSDKDQ